MSSYNVKFCRELTEEEKKDLSDFADEKDSDNESCDDSIADPDYELSDNDDHSDFDNFANDDQTLQDTALDEMCYTLDDDVLMEEIPIGPNRGEKYVGQGKKNKTVWWSMPSDEQKVRTEAMKKSRQESKAGCCEMFTEKKHAFMRFFSDVIESIVINTNRKANSAYAANRNVSESGRVRVWKDTNVDEICAFIGILLHSGAEKANLVQVKDLFHTSHMPFYRAVMSLVRFEQLLRFVRFDDSRTRLERIRMDKLAPIREIWDKFVMKLAEPFVPSKDLCIDEQLLVTRNRCSFRQYIPSKPGKYGIKIFWLVDSKLNYPIGAKVYLGTQPNENRSTGIAHQLVLDLVQPYLNMEMNVTMDNFFTSIPLAEDLASQQTTLVGTIRWNKPELPKKFTSVEVAKNRGPNTSSFCFSGVCELVSYTSKANKNVLLLSSAHATEELNSNTGKPLVIHDYNEHKGRC